MEGLEGTLREWPMMIIVSKAGSENFYGSIGIHHLFKYSVGRLSLSRKVMRCVELCESDPVVAMLSIYQSPSGCYLIDFFTVIDLIKQSFFSTMDWQICVAKF